MSAQFHDALDRHEARNRAYQAEAEHTTEAELIAKTRTWAEKNPDLIQTARNNLELYLSSGFCSAIPFGWFALFIEVMAAENHKAAARLILDTLNS